MNAGVWVQCRNHIHCFSMDTRYVLVHLYLDGSQATLYTFNHQVGSRESFGEGRLFVQNKKSNTSPSLPLIILLSHEC